MKTNLPSFILKSGIIVCVLLIAQLTVFGQLPKGIIKGRVITVENKPANNVSVDLKGTKTGAVTNEDGYFEFKAPAGNYQLIVSHVGLQSQRFDVQVVAYKTSLYR